MDKKLLVKQLLVIFVVVALFVALDLSVFFLYTKPCLPDKSEGRSARTIDVWRYLPFEDDSHIVKQKAEVNFSGELPILDGAEGLYPLFSAFANAAYPEESVQFDGENFSPESKLQMNNTLRAYKGVVEGTVDIVFNASPSQAQLDYAKEKGVELEFVPIGREAFVFIVNGKNPVNGLTVEQIKGAFSGEYTNWQELGGENMPINPLQRLEGSGSQSTLVRFMGDTGIKPNPLGFLGSPLGFTFRFYAEDVVRHGNVKLLSVNGVYPSLENISNGSYPIVSDFYAVYDKNNPNPAVKVLIDFNLSEQGLSTVEQTVFAKIK